ncbi:ribonuclease HII [Bacillus testis]|uniref:ribonuclease HII n=1 Tax=Bacillus testis TaxID=1622072 RepID=UPI00067EAFCE|nr:ribonuclease HII [Bacillus testis]
MEKPVSIQHIKIELQKIDKPDHPFLLECKKDTRKGVQKAVEQWEKKYQHQIDLQNKWATMTTYEQEGRTKGYKAIAGIDEVGRGPLAGPVVAAAVILPEDFVLLGLDDSKKISEKNREIYYERILEAAIAVGIGIVPCETIDSINIYEASKQAMLQAINQLQTAPDYLLIDAMKLPVELPQESIIKGDSKSVSISAASIVAKVTRDRLMQEYDEQYPQYGFKKNMGYGTKEHLEALRHYGVTPLHRLSFAPVREVAHTLFSTEE